MKIENLTGHATETATANLATGAARGNLTAVPERERTIYRELYERRRSLFTVMGRLGSFAPDHLDDGYMPGMDHEEHGRKKKHHVSAVTVQKGHTMGRRSMALPIRDVQVQTPIGPVTQTVFATTTNKYNANKTNLYNVGDLINYEPTKVVVNFHLGTQEGTQAARAQQRDLINGQAATRMTALDGNEAVYIQAEKMPQSETYEWGSVSVPANPETGRPAMTIPMTHPDRLQDVSEAERMKMSVVMGTEVGTPAEYAKHMNAALRTELDEMQPTAMMLLRGLGPYLPQYMRTFTDELDKGPFPFSEAEITSGNMDPTRAYGGTRLPS